MKPFDICLNSFSVSTYKEEETLPSAYTCTPNGLVILTSKDQCLCIEASDEVPLFIGAKDSFLTGKTYSLHEIIRERPFIDLSSFFAQLHVVPEALEAFIGPSLTFAHIEQPDDVLVRVKDLGYGLACKGTSGKHYLDQQVLLLLQLRKLGIKIENIHTSLYDTFDTEGLYSALAGDKKKNRFVGKMN